MSGNPLGSLLGVPDKVELILKDQFFYSSPRYKCSAAFSFANANSTVTAKKKNTTEQQYRTKYRNKSVTVEPGDESKRLFLDA